MQKKKVDKKQNQDQKKEDDEGLDKFEIFAIISSIILLTLLLVLLYILYTIYISIDFNDQLPLSRKNIRKLRETITQADKDKSNLESLKIISTSLENATIAGTIYQDLLNYSLYDQMIYAIQTRSEICREKVHRQTVNQISKLLVKMITNSGYKYKCSTDFIKGYLPICYPYHKKSNSLFSLIDAMAKTSCSKEVFQALTRTSKQSQNFYLNFRIIQYLDQHKNDISDQNEKGDDLICSLSENALENLPQTLNKEVQTDFCKFVDNHKCNVFTEQSILDLCQKEEEDQDL